MEIKQKNGDQTQQKTILTIVTKKNTTKNNKKHNKTMGTQKTNKKNLKKCQKKATPFCTAKRQKAQ